MKKILVIDDDSACRKQICELLIEDRFEVVEAANGKDGIRLAKECHPDVILCDLEMPNGNDCEVLARLHDDRRTAEIPAIVYTGTVDELLLQEVQRLGATAFLPKPFKFRDLIQAITVELWHLGAD
jgi:CheY-like chemotaxis protein